MYCTDDWEHDGNQVNVSGIESYSVNELAANGYLKTQKPVLWGCYSTEPEGNPIPKKQ